MLPKSLRVAAGLSSFAALNALGCGDGDGGGGGGGTAAAAETGAASGGALGGAGGVTSTGGAASGSGGAPAGGASNGSAATGGGPATGGAPVTGGAPSTGGMDATGGVPTIGGTPATGGVPSTGGAPMSGRSSMELVADMGLGWNLGNTLDSVSGDASDDVDETSWGNPPATEALFLALKEDGFRSIRIPVSWRHHLGPAPQYTIDAGWMNRVQTVVDYAIDNDLYAIINLHHDGGGDPQGGAWIRNAANDYDGTLEKFQAVWSQIAARFQEYSDRLVFESMNEVGWDDLPEDRAHGLLNSLNQEFVDLIRSSGGNNEQRHLLIAGYWTDFEMSAAGWELPDDPAGRSILSVHYYTPYQFCIDGSNRTWGSSSELDELLGKFDLLRTAFVARGIPVILGEYGVVTSVDRASRIFWLEYVTKLSCDLGVAPYFWDNGDEFDRTTHEWRTPGLLDAFARACSGADYTPTRQ